MTPPRRPDARRVGSVARAASVLDVLAAAGELGTNELGRRIGTTPSTASRLLATLEGAGLVAYAPSTGRYRLGAHLIELGNAALARLDLRDVARPHLTALVDATGETATLSIPGERDAVTVDFVQSPSLVQGVARIGRPSVAHATATGKVALAFSARPPRLETPLERFTERTIVDPALLEQELAAVRARGFAEARGEREPDLNAVAAPVRDARGELVAIVGIQGPASRFRGARLHEAARLVVERARDLSAALSGR